MRISDWSSDVCSSDLQFPAQPANQRNQQRDRHREPPAPGKGDEQRFDRRGIRHFAPEGQAVERSEEHTSELQSLMRISYAVFCLKKKKITKQSKYEHKNQKQQHKTQDQYRRPT